MSTSSLTRGSVVEQLVFCENRIQELEEQNFQLLKELESLKSTLKKQSTEIPNGSDSPSCTR